jgi:REP element-mobilizing transposase RayT/plasmid maintenance system antidote protein VapI
MPRKARIDTPNLYYHVFARGIEQRDIFQDAIDKNFFLKRLGEVLIDTATPIYAFALMPNHFHLLLRRESFSIATVMQRLLTGYAVNFNKRYQRVGHLFQNRYKAIVCQKESYLLELIRYINLNPLRSGQVKTLAELNKYKYCSHSFVLGQYKAGWFDPDYVLQHFGNTKLEAVQYYAHFLADGLLHLSKPDLHIISLERYLGIEEHFSSRDAKVLKDVFGDGSFIERTLNLKDNYNLESVEQEEKIKSLLATVCLRYAVTKEEIFGEKKERKVANARAILAFKMSKEVCLTCSDVARKLGVTPSAAFKMIRKGKKLCCEK